MQISMAVQNAVVFFNAIVVLLFAFSLGNVEDYSPKPEIGYPAGLIPNCPGVLKKCYNKLEEDANVPNYYPQIEELLDLKNKKTVLYCGGFLDSASFPFSRALGTAYCKRGYNVIMVELFQFLTYIYPKSVRLTKVLGDKIGELLTKLTEQGLKTENLEIVGISLGAHIGGYAAKYLYAATGKKPSRITGLDPAGPCYRSLPPSSKLQASDADRVDIVHTNIDGFGLAEKLGHVDFYVNGGEYQPSDIPAIPCLVLCSHLRSGLYWWQAIEHPKKFIGIKCDSIQDARFAKCFNNSETNYLGLETKFNRPGIYYLPTFNEFPYYRGKEGLKQENEIYTSVSRLINSVNLFEV
ncbi:unnamed protein product [Parnassius apollo]|uniref:(apollo) hypothetical protein n=1 Tax=Parnassius apollo TaxID=110799 RepID=A0A8S3Y892_PARAO|nr:unnamed protein product [Parnassius apollo]